MVAPGLLQASRTEHGDCEFLATFVCLVKEVAFLQSCLAAEHA